MRELPPTLVRTLLRAIRLERIAVGREQRTQATLATSHLMRACVEAGWQVREVAEALGMKRTTASKRVVTSRRAGPAALALVIEPPTGPVRPPRPRPPMMLDEIRLHPVETRDWLRLAEAAEFAGVSESAVHQWRAAGLLPNTRRLPNGWWLYLRADLTRVRTWPVRYNAKGADRRSLLASVTSTPDFSS